MLAGARVEGPNIRIRFPLTPTKRNRQGRYLPHRLHPIARGPHRFPGPVSSRTQREVVSQRRSRRDSPPESPAPHTSSRESAEHAPHGASDSGRKTAIATTDRRRIACRPTDTGKAGSRGTVPQTGTGQRYRENRCRLLSCPAADRIAPHPPVGFPTGQPPRLPANAKRIPVQGKALAVRQNKKGESLSDRLSPPFSGEARIISSLLLRKPCGNP